MNAREEIKQILFEGSNADRLALFAFDVSEDQRRIKKKFDLFSRFFFTRYFQRDNAPFHEEMVRNYIRSYVGDNYLNLAFRGSAKTTYKKLFDVFVLLNDVSEHRKYMKVLTKDGKNSRQVVTDVYNLIVEAGWLYGDVFAKEGDMKREETMGSFTMRNGRKYAAGTVGMTQRGHIQDAYRPDWIWFDDIEDSESIQSLVITEGIIAKCDEAIAGLAINGNYTVTGNYISEHGSIQWFVQKPSVITQITPIMVEGEPTWSAFTKEKIEALREESMDFYGEYMCDPAKAGDKFFDLARIEDDYKKATRPLRESAGVRYWGYYLPHHRYAIGADTSEGIGKDSNTMALFDFTDGSLIATYHNNKIAPDLFGYELMRVGAEFGHCLIAPERNNSGMATISAMKAYPNLYTARSLGTRMEHNSDRIGWMTTRKSKPQMFFEFRKDYNDGLVKILDPEVLKEMRSYSTADLTDSQQGIVTRHFDLLTAVVIAWQMKNYANFAQTQSDFVEEEPLYSDIGM